MEKSKILTLPDLPSIRHLNIKSASDIIIFYDKKLLKNTLVNSWLKKFNLKIALNAGESLKTIGSYGDVLRKLSDLPIHKKTVFVALGGGSVGDFVGFLASTYKRGQPLIQLPSTWISAIDSAHGGKNGLNFNNTKNQIGTYYPAAQIILSKKLLMSQPQAQINDAFGEAFKIGIINQPALLNSVKISSDYLWKNLKTMIAGKYKIVDHDPYEKTGLRQVLNLGHTMGHVFESAHKISHGQSVLLGLMFSARYSFQMGYLKKNEFIKICQILFSAPLSLKYNKVLKIPDQKIKKLLLQDKKRSSGAEVSFIFIHKIGNVFVQPIMISDLLKEVERQRKQL